MRRREFHHSAWREAVIPRKSRIAAAFVSASALSAAGKAQPAPARMMSIV